jgi:general stress protein YciG
MSSTNPSNFANLPKDELREIAAKGGHASHGGHSTESTGGHADRNPDGTFTKGSELAKELGAQGGHAAHHESATGNEGVRTTPYAKTTDTEVLI